MALQNAEMHSRGIGWRAQACLGPRSCDDGLCVQDWANRSWHPEDPLAFAKWRVRASLDGIPAHVLVRRRRVAMMVNDLFAGWPVVIGAVSLATLAGVALCVSRHGRGARAIPA